ncbi:MAG: hypothetical protein LAT84_08805 [Balneolia bacterium]|nr:hypothetical protein [Balneolia bacterium]
MSDFHQRTTLSLFLTACFALFLFSPSFAQDSDFERWQREQQQAFEQFVDDENRRFADFLRRQWSSFEPEAAEPVPDEVPKPDEAPVAPLSGEDAESEEIPAEPATDPEPSPDIDETPTPPSLPPAPPPVRSSPEGTSVSTLPPELRFEWHHHHAPLPPLSVARSFSLPQPDNESIADAWLEMSESNYEEVLSTLQAFSERKQLNEWMFALLVKDYSRNVFAGHNEAVFLSWFLLHQSGFHANAGYTANMLHLLMPVSERLYNQDYYTISASRFYVMRAGHTPVERPGAIRTYEPDEASELGILAMDLHAAPAPVASSAQLISFAFEGKTYEFEFSYDAAYTSLLAKFPSMDPEFYFRAPVSDALHLQMEQALGPILAEMSEAQALNFLLRFSQTAFEYKTDREQFGRQKYMTPDQIIHYPYSDCDDRAIFFAYLVRNFMGLEVIGVTWPGHMATAVRTNSVAGSQLRYDGDTWIICDPTYINANAGMVMPDFRGLEATLHPF